MHEQMLAAEDAVWAELAAKFQLRTVVRISEVQVFHHPQDGSSEAHVEGVCPAGSLYGPLVPCTLYFPLGNPESDEHFNQVREGYQPGSYHWVNAASFVTFDPDAVNLLFLTFATEPATAEQSALLDAVFANSECYDVDGNRIQADGG